MNKIISKDVVKHVANLAKIKIDDSEIDLYSEEMNKVLDYFKIIDNVDTKGIDPTYHVIDQTNVFRKDETQKSLDVDVALKNASQKEKNYIKAPRI